MEKEIVETLIANLRDRKGFKWWWDDIDNDVRDEITKSLESEVETILTSNGS